MYSDAHHPHSDRQQLTTNKAAVQRRGETPYWKPTSSKLDTSVIDNQGEDSSIFPGRNRVLPSEAWHVVQQKQAQLSTPLASTVGTNINNDPGLEREADFMGAKIAQMTTQRSVATAAAEQTKAGSPGQPFSLTPKVVKPLRADQAPYQLKFAGALSDVTNLSALNTHLQAAGYPAVKPADWFSGELAEMRTDHDNDYEDIHQVAKKLGLQRQEAPDRRVAEPAAVAEPLAREPDPLPAPIEIPEARPEPEAPAREQLAPPPAVAPARPLVDQPAARPAQRPDPAQAIPAAFTKNPKSAIKHLTRARLQEILPSYLPAEEGQRAVMAKWDDFMGEEVATYQTVPMLIHAALGEEAAKASIEHVKDANAAAAPDVEEHQAVSTLFRGDTRKKGQIIEAKGLHGWGGSLSLAHARAWVRDVWETMNNGEKGAWLQTWKAETSSRIEAMPFLATGWESQKAGAEYQIDVPFQIPNPRVTPSIAFDGDNLDNATIICVTGRGEVLFLTGIPVKYITPVTEKKG